MSSNRVISWEEEIKIRNKVWEEAKQSKNPQAMSEALRSLNILAQQIIEANRWDLLGDV